MNALAELLSSKTRAELFRLLFGLHDAPLHLREIERQTGLAVATVRQEIEKLARLGLVARHKDGNRVCYAANRAHPLYAEIRGLVLKTAGLVDVLRSALTVPGVHCAFVFGSIANGSETPASDIDLIVIGEIGLRKVTSLLSGLGTKLGREINAHVLTPADFARRRQEQEHFIANVMAAPKIFIVGTEHELAAMGR